MERTEQRSVVWEPQPLAAALTSGETTATHAYTTQGIFYFLFIHKLEVQGSFTPFGRSGRVTHTDVYMMHVSMILIVVSMCL